MNQRLPQPKMTDSMRSFKRRCESKPPSFESDLITSIDGTIQFSDEILVYIFDYLFPPELVLASRVCHRWQRLAQDNQLWKRLFHQEFACTLIPSSEYQIEANLSQADRIMSRQKVSTSCRLISTDKDLKKLVAN
jgi:hypothetical protein